MFQKRFLLLLGCMFLMALGFAQLQSPEQFLGYKLGSRYTPHWRIVQYYQHVAANAPAMVKLQPYGQTIEGRPLMVAFVSQPQNISNLESIRIANLALTSAASGNTANVPAIVWLSYNVHGNETSSSEAGLMTLWALVDPANTQSKGWLQNTVVVLDPCINPDGRDRYVNWFTSVMGKNNNPALEAREHREPWPGGRTNHYNFDLNRDWAWQTQLESQQRMKLYNQWLPHVHVDFHEQGINNPYYFAPAAQPYHEVITQRQRDFQKAIGRNHARYFDEKGWLYFTREVFDLLYPSYGDTYPIYNGAIGMTYEQGGGSAGGVAVLTETGDTLTLLDRVQHHFTTGISTIEVASGHAKQLVGEFRNFFANSYAKGVGPYASYVVKWNGRDEQRISALLQLLQKNNIQYYGARSGNYRGLNYMTGKEESFTAGERDVVIPVAQQKGTLVKVLFEPNTTAVDSATYDITAWALPYAYGLGAYATKTAVGTTGQEYSIGKTAVTNASDNAYGYVIPWGGLSSVRLVSQLMQKGIKLRMNEQPFEMGGQRFERGSIIVLKTSNQYYPNLWSDVKAAAQQAGVALTPVSGGLVEQGYDFGSSRVHPLKKRKVALLTGEGVGPNAAGEVWYYFDQVIGYPVTLINVNDFGRIRLNDYDVLIMPDGGYRFLNDKASADALKTWVQGGGNLIALEGAVAQLARQDWGLKSKKNDEGESKEPYAALRRFENRERDYIPGITPGSIFRVELDNSHPLAFGFPAYYYTLKQDDNIYEFLKDDGWNVGVLKKDRQVAGFVGSRLKNRLQDGLLFGVQNMGNGTVTYLADNPLFRSFWENGRILFANAVFLVGQ